jgi:predicted nucleic acid binding AN1-type Zn finger protein
MKKPATLAKENSIKDTLPLVDEQLNDESQKLGEFKVSSEWVAKTYDKDLTVLVGKTDKQGNIRVVSVVPAYSKGMTNWAKKQIAIFLIEKQAEAKKNEKVLRKKEALKSATAKSKKNNSATETVGELLAA